MANDSTLCTCGHHAGDHYVRPDWPACGECTDCQKFEAAKTYEITEAKNNHDRIERSIKCLTCGMVSWNKDDVRHKYCANCGVFHELEVVRRRRSTA